MLKKIQMFVPVLHVTDLHEAIGFFTTLGFENQWRWGDPPFYAGMYFGESGEYALHLSQKRGTPGCSAALYIQVPDVDEVFELCQEKGLTVLHALDDQPYGMRDFSIEGPEGIVISIGSESGEAS